MEEQRGALEEDFKMYENRNGPMFVLFVLIFPMFNLVKLSSS
jgi:hypothetical protein